MKTLTAFSLLLVALVSIAAADGLGDNDPQNVRQVPRVGVDVPDADRQVLQAGLDRLQQSLQSLIKRTDPQTQRLLPDVEIFHRAVRDALTQREFFAKPEIARGKELLRIGQQRADALLVGQAPWTTQTGLVVRGYRSRIDRTSQPYGLVIPASYRPVGTDRLRCDLWFHGRGETLSEVKFIDQRMRQTGRIAPADTIVLHPYGRYSNAFKFAGEIDVLEALEHAKQNYRLDDDRIAVRGFSMGGAGCWQFAVHYADRFFAATPGAGFSETPQFLESFQKETLHPTWYERKLWHMYDCDDVAVNLMNTATIAYSGELDTQKQAADVMEAAAKEQGIDLMHLIGPGTKHAIHKDSLIEIERRLQDVASRGRDRLPQVVRFATYTLKYNRMHWVTVDRLGEHWEQARVDAAWNLNNGNRLNVATKNVTALTFSMPAGWCPFDATNSVALTIDKQTLRLPRPRSDRSWSSTLHKTADGWKLGPAPDNGPRKRHNLQGPIDDAFMDSFLVVRPTGKARHPAVETWTRSELDHCREHWRRQFRGDIREKNDVDVTDDDIADSNLILFGDTQSNRLLKRISADLSIQWNAQSVTVGKHNFDAKHHAPILIRPNPLNPKRYVVVNSGFTYREYAYLNNARQVPMLPDWAVVDLRTPPGSQFPGKIVAADFFNENWQLKP